MTDSAFRETRHDLRKLVKCISCRLKCDIVKDLKQFNLKTHRYQILCSVLICSEGSKNNEDHVKKVGKDGRPHVS